MTSPFYSPERWRATCWHPERFAGPLLGSGVGGQQGHWGKLLHRPSEWEQPRHRRRALPGHREHVGQLQLLCQHAGVLQGLLCEVLTLWPMKLRTAWSSRCSVCVCVQEVKYDLEDLERWEPVLAGVTCKKKLKDKVLKRKEIRFLGKLNSEQEVGFLARRVKKFKLEVHKAALT